MKASICFSRMFVIASMGFGSAMVAVPAQAKGCVKGAAVGAVAGHVAGDHAVAGGAAGCVIGRHKANKKDKQEKAAAGQRQAADGERKNDDKQ